MATNSIKDDLENLKSHVDSMDSASKPAGAEQTENASGSDDEEGRKTKEMLQKMAERLEAEKNRLLEEWQQESGKIEKDIFEEKQRLENEIRTNPLASIAIAFGAGFIIARLFGR